MFEKVNPNHPDKIADRIAGALVDLAYKKSENPKIAAEVLIGHGHCTVILETSEDISKDEVQAIVTRISGKEQKLNLVTVPQDKHLADNQAERIKCGDNGIFRGCPELIEHTSLTEIAATLYNHYGSDGKYLTAGAYNVERQITICQSNATEKEIEDLLPRNDLVLSAYNIIINPLGPWTGGLDVDSGATNRKLGSDMGDAVTGGGLHGKDLSKADVSINIFLHLLANVVNVQKKYCLAPNPLECYCCCSIGDEYVNVCGRWGTLIYGVSFKKIVEYAHQYIKALGGFEKFAEWGLIRPKTKESEEESCKNLENLMENI